MATKKELKARIAELEKENARLARKLQLAEYMLSIARRTSIPRWEPLVKPGDPGYMPVGGTSTTTDRGYLVWHGEH
jgi:hypothetical protein